MLHLPDVTLVAVYTVEHELTLAAVDECCRHAQFGAVRLFTDRDQGRDTILTPPFTGLRGAGEFTTYEVPKHIETSHALFIHWDSWVVDPAAWTDEFLACDYVGAPWWYRDGMNVGNSGFCLRSRRLLDFLAAHPDEFPLGSPEDHVLCREYRPRLPQFQWASDALAKQFSFERTPRPVGPCFGFHGMFNWPAVMTDDQIWARLARATPYVSRSSHYRELLGVMYNRWRQPVVTLKDRRQ